MRRRVGAAQYSWQQARRQIGDQTAVLAFRKAGGKNLSRRLAEDTGRAAVAPVRCKRPGRDRTGTKGYPCVVGRMREMRRVFVGCNIARSFVPKDSGPSNRYRGKLFETSLLRREFRLTGASEE